MLRKFPAKVLLFGEYTILNGSKALALPFHQVSGAWSFEKNESETSAASRKSLREFHLKKLSSSIDYELLGEDLDKGLWFDSTIPNGYGLGSSGAVIAAIFDRYGKSCGDIYRDKEMLARLEDFFHGSSSGLDPLVSFAGHSLLIHSFNEIESLETSPHLDGFFLLNTGKPRQTGALISIYQEKMKDPQFKQGCAEILSREVNFAIDAVISGDKEKIFHHMWHISKFQWEYFPEMIPTKERNIWARGIESGEYALKLCGAGGGGFILGYAHKHGLQKMKELLGTEDLISLV